MNEISKHQDTSPNLSIQEKNIVLASRASKIQEMKRKDVADAITELVGASFVILNQAKMQVQDRAILEQQIVNDLFEKFPHMTIEEVKNAFYLGTRGEFKNKPEDVVFISVALVYSWFKSYRENIKREAMKKQRQFEVNNEKDKTLTDEQKSAVVKSFLLCDVVALFQYYKAHKSLHDAGGTIYQILEKNEFINIPNSRKWEVYEEAEKLIRREFSDDRRYIKLLNEGLEEAKERVRIKARQLSLKEYFDGLIEMEIELEDLIKERFEL